MATLSYAIMAHPSREKWIPDLLNQMPMAEVVWDEKNEVWDTGRRALMAHGATTHHLVVQDDAILSHDFIDSCHKLIEYSGDYPVCLYMGRSSPAYRRMAEVSIRKGTPWFFSEGPRWGPAVIMPTELIDGAVKWGDRDHKLRGYDAKLTRFCRRIKKNCIYTVPSLVDHRSVDENPSLFAGRTADRHAYKFRMDIADRVDWSIPPYRRQRYSHYSGAR